MTTGAHALIFTGRALQSTATTWALTIKVCLTAAGAASTAKERHTQIPTRPRMKVIIALGVIGMRKLGWQCAGIIYK
jgi:hypothetical protein